MMISLIRKILPWVLPEKIINLLIAFFEFFRNFDFDRNKILSRNKALKDMHKGKRCFVIGNGPSLAKQDLSYLKDEITIVVNAFWKHPIISKDWQPNYYCLADPALFEEGEGFESMLQFFTDLKKTEIASHFLLPYSSKKVIEKHKIFDDKQISYICFEGVLKSYAKIKDGIDLTAGVPGVQSVSQMAIELALYIGCNPIYLLGLDHDWLAKRGIDNHFYKGKTLKNHPTAEEDLTRVSYKGDMEACLLLWEGYEVLLNIAKIKNVQIINATGGGFLDVFPRQNYNDIVKKKKL